MRKFTKDKIYKDKYLFIDRLKVIKNNMNFSHLFIFFYDSNSKTLNFLLSLW